MKIILLNYYSRNSLAVAKALDPAYTLIGGEVLSSKRWPKPDRYFKHRRIQEIFRHANPKTDPQTCAQDIISACKRYGADAILATGTEMTNFLSEHKQAISAQASVTVMVEDFDKLTRMTDKWGIVEVANAAGVRVPQTVAFEDPTELRDAVTTIGLSAVMKPRRSFASIGVRIFHAQSDVDSYLAEVARGARHRSPGGFVLQQFIPGKLMDVNVCAQDGRVLSALTQRRLQTLYDFGGGGIVNMTTDEPEARDLARKISQTMRWNGPCQYEFMAGDDGKYYLIEANPKLWGTTYLSVAAGNNIPQQSVDVFTSVNQVKETPEYEKGLLFRWIFPECVFNWIQKPRNIDTIKRRISETFADYGASRKLNNLELDSFLHIFGVILNGSKL